MYKISTWLSVYFHTTAQISLPTFSHSAISPFMLSRVIFFTSNDLDNHDKYLRDYADKMIFASRYYRNAEIGVVSNCVLFGALYCL